MTRAELRLREASWATAVVVALTAAGVVAQPANDDCTSASPIVASGLPFVQTLDTSLATVEPGELAHSCTGNVDGNSVWYEYTAGSDLTIDIDTTGSLYGAVIAVYDGTCAALVERNCYTDPGGADSRLPIALNTGDTVLIQISDPANVGGLLTFQVREAPYGVIDPVATLEVANSATISTHGTGLGWIARPTVLKPRKLAFGATDYGIFQSVGGALSEIVSTGDPTPAGGTFHNFSSPALSGGGAGVFRAEVRGSTTVTSGIFAFGAGGISTVAVTGDPAPTGGVFTRFGPNVSINQAGDILFAAATDTAPAWAAFDLAGGALTARAVAGDPHPCGGTIARIDEVDINQSGDIAFYATSTAGADGLLVDIGGTVSAVGCVDGPEPSGGTYDRINQFQLSDTPEIVYHARIDVGTRIEAVYAGAPTAPAQVVKEGLLVGPVIVDDIANGTRPGINNAGQVVVSVGLAAPDRHAILRIPSGGPPAIAVRDGDPCGAGLFGRAGRVTSINSAGVISFDSVCTIGNGVFRTNAGGGVQRLAGHTTPTAIGAGFDFEDADIDAADDMVFLGRRKAVYGVRCTAAGNCTPPTVLASAGDPWPGAPGATVLYIHTESVSGVRNPVFSLGVADGAILEGIGVVRGGTLRRIAETGQPIGVAGAMMGVFADNDPFDPQSLPWRPAGHGGRFAFAATVTGHPTIGRAVFIYRGGTTVPIAGEGDPSPDGGVFEDFSSPAILGSKVTFAALTSVGQCVMYARRPTQLAPVACIGDTGPLGTVIDEILAPPAFAGKSVLYLARLTGGSVSQCLIQWTPSGPSAPTPVLCDGDVVPNGGTYAAFSTDDGSWLETDRKGFAFNGADRNDDVGIHAFYKGSLAEVAADGDAAPASGTYEFADLHYSMAKYSVAFTTLLNGGAGEYGVFLSNLR